MKTPTKAKASARKGRVGTRVIDKIINEASADGLSQALNELERHWESISLKAGTLETNRFATALNWPRPMLPFVPLTEDETLAVYAVLRQLLDPTDSDSLRKARRDVQVATDYIFHRDILRQRKVMPWVCQRWGLKPPTVKAAARVHAAEALCRIQSLREIFETPQKLTGDEATMFVDLADMPESNFEAFMARFIDERAKEYREDKGAAPRGRE
jgi:hypothetical protein